MQTDWAEVITQAKEHVQNINMISIKEMRCFANPPPKILLATQLLVLILTGEIKEWNNIKK